jgi:hypothetical protein
MSEFSDYRSQVKKVLDIEKEEANVIKNLGIEGFWIWPIFRIQVSNYFATDYDFSKTHGKENRKLNNTAILILKYIKKLTQIIKYPFWHRSEILFKTISNSRRDVVDGYYKDIYFGDLIERLSGHKYAVLESLGVYNRHFKNVKEKRKIIFDDFVLPLSHFIRVKGKPEYDEVINSIVSIGDKYKIPVLNRKYVENRIYSFIKLKKINKFILKKISPRLILLFCSYGKESFIAAAKELDIQVVEVQHGLLEEWHLGYSYPDELKKMDNINYPIPDYFFSYGDYYTEILKKCSLFKHDRIITTGNPRIDFWKSRIDEKRENENSIKVVVTSQRVITDKLIEYMNQAIEYIKSNSIRNVHFIIKLHPGEMDRFDDWKRIIENYENIKIIQGDEPNLYEYLVKSGFHASVTSSTHIESILLGIPTFIIKLPGWELYSREIDRGLIIPAENPADFVEKIVKYGSNRNEYGMVIRRLRDYSETFQKDNSIQCNIDAVEMILKNI